MLYLITYDLNAAGQNYDDLITATPCFLVTDRLKEWIERAMGTGCTFADVTVSTSELFEELHPGQSPPHFSWLKINGTASRDDFGLTATASLVVSERALQILKQGRLDNCDITPV